MSKKNKKRYDLLYFMSWDEKDGDEYVRAIALCDSNEFFDEAIKAPRDGSMGKKDENGVYERIWYGDYIGNGGDVKNVSYATREEVDRYLRYCPIENRRDMCDDEHVVAIIHEPIFTVVIVCYYTTLAIRFRRVVNRLRRKYHHYKYLIKYRLWNKRK